MMYYRLMQEGFVYSYIAHANAPTVTMPRLKALTSGMIPSFVDAVLNLDNARKGAMKEDNWLRQMLSSKYKKARFFGDETWLKLFPSIWDQYEGTNSFFVAVSKKIYYIRI